MNPTDILLWQVGILILQTSIFTLTLYALFKQNKSLKKSIDLVAYQDVVNRIQRLDEMILNKPQLGKLLPKDYSDSDESEIKRISFTYMTIDFFEMIFILKEKEVISEEMWEPWKNSIIRCFTQSSAFQEIWELKVNPKQMYYKPFRDFINENVKFNSKEVN